MKNSLAIHAVTAVLCMMPICAAAQERPPLVLSEEQKRAIAEETAKLKAAGPQRDHSDRVVYDKTLADGRARAAAALKAAAAKPTPHTADGKPDLNGVWISGTGVSLPVIISEDGKSRKVLFGPLDEGGTRPRDVVPAMGPNQPSYKKEFQAKVHENWFDTNHTDPTAFNCMAPGVPRMGMPAQIIQAPGVVTLLYHQLPHFRVIYTDGRTHRTDVDPSAQGDSVGHFEGDALVIDVTTLTDDTWLSSNGTLHSDQTHVIERLTRKGDTLEYSATVEDPKVLTKPWTTTPTTRVLGGKDDALVNEYPCVDTIIDGVPDSKHLTGLIHH